VIIIAIITFYILIRIVINQNRKINELEFKLRSTSVKHGQNFEQFVPFTKEFEKIANKENFVFIGKPIDGIAFEDDAIKFIEIKTGKSGLNESQRKIKDNVKNKKIEWHELRF
jgi:predicted Holliday junction resolvase-like endonuclease